MTKNLGLLYLIFAVPIILKYGFFVAGGVGCLRHKCSTDLFSGPFMPENLFVGLVFFCVFHFVALTSLRYFSAKKFNGSRVGKRSSFSFLVKSIVVSFFLVFSNLLTISLALALLGFASKGLEKWIFLASGAVAYVVGLWREILEFSLLPPLYIFLYAVGMFLMSQGDKYLRLSKVIYFVGLLAFVFGLISLTYIWQERLFEQVAPATWRDDGAWIEFFQLGNILSGMPHHRFLLVSDGVWAPQFQISYLFKYDHYLFLSLAYYFFLAGCFGYFLARFRFSFINKDWFGSLLFLIIIFYLATGPVTERIQALPGSLAAFLFMFAVFKFMPAKKSL